MTNCKKVLNIVKLAKHSGVLVSTIKHKTKLSYSQVYTTLRRLEKQNKVKRSILYSNNPGIGDKHWYSTGTKEILHSTSSKCWCGLPLQESKSIISSEMELEDRCPVHGLITLTETEDVVLSNFAMRSFEELRTNNVRPVITPYKQDEIDIETACICNII